MEEAVQRTFLDFSVSVNLGGPWTAQKVLGFMI